ncbi:MAG TPA: pirin family protein [Terriglobales bacterium]|nr:pirin family protein [Terriglobales bacterium]
MIKVRNRQQRGHANHGWLDTYHTFSFADYYDPANMGFRALRVINEDFVQPSMGFGMHAHQDMEILTFVLEGALEHRDSMGNGSVIRPGDVQHMSAGTGVRHSEYNPSATDPVHLLQIWILPEKKGIEPSYDQRTFQNGNNKLKLVASHDANDGSLILHQDAKIFQGKLQKGATLSHELSPQRHAWLQVTRGGVKLNGIELHAGDGAAITSENELNIAAATQPENSEILLFDLA